MRSRRELERLTARYMKEIRDADKANLTVRQYLREGLVSGGAGLLALRRDAELPAPTGRTPATTAMGSRARRASPSVRPTRRSRTRCRSRRRSR